MIVAPSLPAFNASQVPPSDGPPNGRQIVHTNCAEIQTDAPEAGRHLQRVSWSGVSTGCQTGARHHGAAAAVQQVGVANMATQVSVGGCRNASCPSRICDTGTQVSGHGLSTVDGSQITDMAVQASVDVVNSGTQIAGGFHGGVCVENTASQASATLVNSGTQMDLLPRVSAVAVQTNCAANVANMAIQASNQISDFAHMATQATGQAGDMFDVSTEVPYAFAGPSLAQAVMNPGLVQTHSALAGTNTATQASLPYITLNRGGATNTIGTQMAAAGLPEESETASTGMQTSVTLIPSRPKFGVIAQTQTPGDHILKSAMVSANIPVVKSPGRKPRAKGRSPARKRTVRSSEVQTQDCFSQRKKRRVKGPAGRGDQGAAPQDSSIATQTFPVPFAQPPDFLAPGSVRMQQNPTLASSAMQEAGNEAWDPFLSASYPPRNTTSDTGLQADLDEFLSTYTAELGVQTQDDFLSACTAEFGVQTQEPYLETCRADLGVQTVMTSIGSLLADLDRGVGCAAVAGSGDAAVGAEAVDAELRPGSSAGSAVPGCQSGVDCGTWTEVLTLDSQTQTSKTASSAPGFSAGVRYAECGTEVDSSLSAFHAQSNQKLFESFDSDLSFSDCGTGTEDFFASTHTQTGTEHRVNESATIPSALSALDCGTETDDSLSHTPTPSSLGIQGDFELSADDSMDPFLPSSSQSWDTNQASSRRSTSREPDPTLPSFNFDQIQSDSASQMTTTMTTSTGSSTTTGTDLAAVAAADMHTQTADDLLDFLMNNMETQTTEDLPDDNLAMADTQTQTTGSVLLTPPHPLAQSPGASLSPFEAGDALGLVTAETQTSTQLMFELDDDGDEFFNIADMQTQTTMDWLLD